jgi:hypothetical protein
MQPLSDQEIKSTFDIIHESEKELPVSLQQPIWEEDNSPTYPQEIIITRITNALPPIGAVVNYARME